jgi:hypothetical protein
MWWEGGAPAAEGGLASNSGAASGTSGGGSDQRRSGQQQQKHAREDTTEAVVDARGPGLFAGRVIHAVLQVRRKRKEKKRLIHLTQVIGHTLLY